MPIHIFPPATTCVAPLLVCTVAALVLPLLVPLAAPLAPLEGEPLEELLKLVDVTVEVVNPDVVAVDVLVEVTVAVPLLVVPAAPLDEEEEVPAPPAGVDSVKIDSEVPVGVKRAVEATFVHVVQA